MDELAHRELARAAAETVVLAPYALAAYKLLGPTTPTPPLATSIIQQNPQDIFDRIKSLIDSEIQTFVSGLVTVEQLAQRLAGIIIPDAALIVEQVLSRVNSLIPTVDSLANQVIQRLPPPIGVTLSQVDSEIQTVAGPALNGTISALNTAINGINTAIGVINQIPGVKIPTVPTIPVSALATPPPGWISQWTSQAQAQAAAGPNNLVTGPDQAGYWYVIPNPSARGPT